LTFQGALIAGLVRLALKSRSEGGACPASAGWAVGLEGLACRFDMDLAQAAFSRLLDIQTREGLGL